MTSHFLSRLLCGGLLCLAAAPLLAMPTERPVGRPEAFARFYGPTPIGVAVSRSGRVFVSFPRAFDPSAFCVGELKNGRAVPFPNKAMQNVSRPNRQNTLISVQGMTIDARDRLWLLDLGLVGAQPTLPGGPKLVGVDLKTNKIFKTILFPRNIAGPNAYLNDVRVSLKIGTDGTAFISDSSEKGPNGIVVVDLASGEARRRLNNHPSVKAEPRFVGMAEGVEVIKRPPHGPFRRDTTGVDGIALSSDGASLFYCPNEGRHLYSVSTAALADSTVSDADAAATVKDLGAKGGASDGIETDAQGNLYLTDWEHDSLVKRGPDGGFQTVARGQNLIWPDSIAVGLNGYVYFTVNQLNRQKKYHHGIDQRQKPYTLFRVKTGSTPNMPH